MDQQPKVFIEVAILKICDKGYKPKQSDVPIPAIEQLNDRINQLEQQLKQISSQTSETNQPAQMTNAPKRNASANRNSFKVPIDRIRNVLNDASNQLSRKFDHNGQHLWMR
ncbi:hypothetical protein JCM21714_4650 [Gracilibacillus boraciitolerans JCM 21714]|uniref:Uncharacterized protein n=1 Tax=Gracilibacillus boraciitolerans JCM 21714 TaxID=1298598 RepID=W4VQC3_9BACI|nr:hypothetical protein JCM21714_4650 [Gracilibacillus boraciitolerans JCM 21714]